MYVKGELITHFEGHMYLLMNVLAKAPDVAPENLYYTGKDSGQQELIALRGKDQILKCLFAGK